MRKAKADASAARPLDAIDRQLLALLAEDGRASSAALAKVIGTSERTVRNRIKALREDGVLRISGFVQPSAVGFHVTARVTVEVEPGLVQEIAQKLAEHPLVSYAAFPIGGGNIVALQVLCRNSEQLGQLLNDNFSRIPGIRNVTFQIVHRTLKDNFNWRVPEDA
ncbi:MAG: Lrp/AsnC family transcriptional regulator [Chloroflexota bacterium]